MRALKLLIAILFLITIQSCMSYTSVVGAGAKGNEETTKKNHYLVEGLIKLKTSDSKTMASGSNDYTIHTRVTFVDGLLWFLTGGIYSPSTTTVTK